MRMHIRWMCLPLVVLFLAACNDWDFDGGRYQQDFHFSYPLAEDGSVQLENSNGSVEISGWDQNTVEIDGTKYATNENRLREIRIDVTPSPHSIAIRTVPPLDRYGNYGARYVIHVPRRAELNNIVSSNGSLRVDTIEGPAYLKTSNGSIRAEIRKGGLEARTSNGSIEARVMEADANPVRLESSNGRIDLTMDAAREVHARTSNSSITVRMPASAGANLRAHTSNSSINSDFEVSVHGGTISKHQVEGAIGAGGPVVDLETTNGRINLMKL